MPHRFPTRRHAALVHGFSLVEVTLALGIFAFAFVGLLGMLPIGLATSANAIDATVESQIVQTITTRARQSKFSALEELNKNPDPSPKQTASDFFFDDQGREIPSLGTPPPNYVYGAAVVITKHAKAISTFFPTEGGGTVENSSVATLGIVVSKISAPRDARVVGFYVANNGL